MTKNEMTERFIALIKSKITALNSVFSAEDVMPDTLTHAQYPAAAVEITHTITGFQNPTILACDVSVILLNRSWKDIKGKVAIEELNTLMRSFRTNIATFYSLSNSLGADKTQAFGVLTDENAPQRLPTEQFIYSAELLYSIEFDSL